MAARLVDPRAVRFGAALTAVVLVVVLVTGWWPLLAVQSVVFGIGAFVGMPYSPYVAVYRGGAVFRMGPPAERVDARPPQFAQGLGLVFALVGVFGYAFGQTSVGVAATSVALFAAFLKAAFDVCLGCEIYLFVRRALVSSGPMG